MTVTLNKTIGATRLFQAYYDNIMSIDALASSIAISDAALVLNIST